MRTIPSTPRGWLLWLNEGRSIIRRRNTLSYFILHCDEHDTLMNTASTRVGSSTIWSLLSNPTIQAALGVLIVLTVSAIAYYYLSKLRGSNNQDQLTPELLQKNFEEMRSGGDISEAEFRRISASLGQTASSPKQTSKDGNKT